MSVQLAAQDFATPDKGGPNNNNTASTMGAAYQSNKKDATSSSTNSQSVTTTTTTCNSVTPMEASGKTTDSQNNSSSSSTTPLLNAVTPHGSHPTSAASGKQVRFGEEETNDGKSMPSESPANSKRGLVSRRGGRFVSPARSIIGNTAASTPSSTAAVSSSVTPKEHSVLEYKTFHQSAGKPENSNDSTPSSLQSTHSVGLVSMPSESEKDTDQVPSKTEGDLVVDSRRPTSISCGPSHNFQTSPLTKSSPQKECPSFDDEAKSLIRSPVPTQSYERFKKTPTKSPGQFTSLPSLDDAQLQSPGGIFLSPHPPTPQLHKSAQGTSFDREEHKEEKHDDTNQEKVRDYTKDKFALTPTNFSMDYGKGNFGAFDTSNVLNWLQSPTANGLFSPGGGLNSIMNTPKGPIMPRTPGTPTMSQSFFFSDVASLPRDATTPQRGEADAAKSSKKGLSNIICISPLASSRHRNGSSHQANTPINYHDVFASPNPLLEDSPVKSMLRARGGGNGQQQNGKNPSLDAVNLAERDLMQDDDLNVLLQLAGGNTPKAVKSGSAVFRGAGARPGGSDSNGRENLPALPVINDREGDSSVARLSRKSHSRDHRDGDSFVTAQLAIRASNSDAQPKDVPSSGAKLDPKGQHPGANLAQRSDSKPMAVSSTGSKPGSNAGQQAFAQAQSANYPPRPPAQEMYGFPSMPPHGMRPTGRMSVVVGGPPPSSRAPKPSPGQTRHMGASQHVPRPGEGYPPPGMSYPPPHGHYPHHPVHMPYHSHYGGPHRAPHPSQRMSIYGQRPGATLPLNGKKASKPLASTPGKGPQKRPSLSPGGDKSAKKQKKSPAPKKRKSPQLTDRADRQKAAQSIASMNAASGGKNDKAAALAAAILRGVTMRPSGKWQAQLYFAGKSRYIGVFDTREKAALAYEIAREKLKAHKDAADGPLTPKQTENAVNAARKAAFDGVQETNPNP